jgi:fumarate reductase subunit D
VAALQRRGGGFRAADAEPPPAVRARVSARLAAPPDHGHLLALVSHPLARVVLLALFVLSLFHWAHRFRYTLYDGLQIKHLNEVINAACYGGAVAGSLAAGYLLFVRLP